MSTSGKVASVEAWMALGAERRETVFLVPEAHWHLLEQRDPKDRLARERPTVSVSDVALDRFLRWAFSELDWGYRAPGIEYDSNLHDDHLKARSDPRYASFVGRTFVSLEVWMGMGAESRQDFLGIPEGEWQSVVKRLRSEAWPFLLEEWVEEWVLTWMSYQIEWRLRTACGIKEEWIPPAEPVNTGDPLLTSALRRTTSLHSP